MSKTKTGRASEEWGWCKWAVLLLGLLFVVLAVDCAYGAERYVWKSAKTWEPGDRVLNLPLALGFLPDAISVTTDTGDDFWMDIVTRGEAASDTVAGSGDAEVRYEGSGEMIPAEAVFLVRSAVSATDSVVVRGYKWQ